MVDNAGNVYSTGSFTETVDFDPGPGTYSLTAAGGKDSYISKVDASGNFLWAKRIGGTGSDISYGITVDAAGNVYSTGSFTETVDFDPGPGTYSLTATGGKDSYISKLDASGNFLWAKQIGGAGYDEGYSIAVDGMGNVYTTGYFTETADFNPGPGINAFTTRGGTNGYISKLDGSGDFLWAKRIEGAGSNATCSIALDQVGNAYITGSFTETAYFPDFGALTLTASGAKDSYISKLDGSGNFLWVKQIGGTGDDAGCSIAVDGTGNVFTTGYFTETVDFDPGPGTYSFTSIRGASSYISKLDAAGNFLWAKHMASQLGNLGSLGSSISVDASGNVYSTGFFQETADFDPGPALYNLTSAGGLDGYISKLDASGNFVWATSLGSTGYDEGMAIIANKQGVYITGVFTGIVDFDSGPNPITLTSQSTQQDVFVSKLDVSRPTLLLKASAKRACVGDVVSLVATIADADNVTWSFPVGTVLRSDANKLSVSASILTSGVKTFTATNTISQVSSTVTVTAIGMSSTRDGVWTDLSTWSCGRLPTLTDVVTIAHSVRLPAGAQPARQLLYAANGRLDFTAGAQLTLFP
ncbi:hypothetical protein GCM10028805_03610 [Spirosoma harenae]